jgi:putative SOS response-associated peptidase YedK
MCNRYGAYHDPSEMIDHFGVHRLVTDLEQIEELLPRFNVAPTDTMPVIRLEDGDRALELMRWSLVPFWAKDIKIGVNNVPSETALEKPAFPGGDPAPPVSCVGKWLV